MIPGRSTLWYFFVYGTVTVIIAVLLALLFARPTEAASAAAPSRFHRIYPAATQHARDWAWRGLGNREFACLDALWHFESGWRVEAYGGLPQARPPEKMRSAGADWETNPMTQARWGLRYVHARYGTPCNAWAVWQRQHWY
jgi:hypothetical protein